MMMHTLNDKVASLSARALWGKLLSDREAAKTASDLYNSTVHNPLYEKLERTSPRPNLSFEIEALDGKVSRYHIDPGNLHALDDHWSPVIRRNAATIKAAWLTHRETRERLDMDAVNDESDRLVDEQCAIESALLTAPAPDAAALLWKLEHLFGPEARDDCEFSAAWCSDWMNALMSDAHRLLNRSTSPLLAWSVEGKAAA